MNQTTDSLRDAVDPAPLCAKTNGTWFYAQNGRHHLQPDPGRLHTRLNLPQRLRYLLL